MYILDKKGKVYTWDLASFVAVVNEESKDDPENTFTELEGVVGGEGGKTLSKLKIKDICYSSSGLLLTTENGEVI